MTVPDVTPEIPGPAWRTILALLGRIPQGGLSRAFGKVADAALPRPLRRPVLSTFARAVGADVGEAELALSEYGSINDFFVRRLRPGVRRWPGDPALAGSPVDAFVGQLGPVAEGRLIQAKGRRYTAAALLDDPDEAGRYEGGTFVTLYLSPRHYHRIHAPTDGLIPAARHVPGALLPVNAPAVAHVPELLPRNERLVCYLEGPLGRIAIVAVGAYNVGRISAAFDPDWAAAAGRRWVTNRPGARPTTRVYDPPRALRQGDEVMAFHLGSTVVLLFEPGRVAFPADLRPNAEVRLGQPIARRLSHT